MQWLSGHGGCGARSRRPGGCWSGMGGMHWRNFVIFNVLGGITWSTVFTLLGYFFGGIPFVQEHFELLIIGIVAVSIIPTVVGLVKAKLGKKNA